MKISVSRSWDGDQFKVIRDDGGEVTGTRLQTAEVILIDFSDAHPIPACAHALDDFLDAFDAHDDIAKHLPAARKEIAEARQADSGKVTLATLRLAKGMSQKQLAAAIGTSQSMLSLIESRQQKPGEDTIRGLAQELKVSFDLLMEALANG